MQTSFLGSADLRLPDAHEFWAHLDQLLAGSRVVIDRPKGSCHPRYPGMIYPLDYGYLEGTEAMDGGGIDLWLGSREEKSLQAIVLTVDLQKRDAELKLLLGCTPDEQQAVLDFLNGNSMRGLLVRRELGMLTLLRTRRSVRRFLTRPVPQDVLERILEAATWAPSAHNRQPWRFAVLLTPEAKTRLAVRMGAEFRRDLLSSGLTPDKADAQVIRSRNRIREAPVGILLCLDPSVGDAYPDPDRQQAEFLMGTQSVAMAGGTLLLAAHAEGLGGVWICAPLFASLAARQALDLPEEWQPQALLLLGYPEKIPNPRQRRPVGEIARFL